MHINVRNLKKMEDIWKTYEKYVKTYAQYSKNLQMQKICTICKT